VNYKIVSDSSANLFKLKELDFQSVPLHIIVADKDFEDSETLDLNEMQNSLSSHNGKSSTSCPSSQEWMDAFGNADVIFCVTLTSGLSGAYNSAKIAASMYESDYPGRKVYVIDSLSTGPEMVLLIHKIAELIQSGTESDVIFNKVCEYKKRTHLYFELSSLDNFVKNGRINSVVAKSIGMLGIKIIGTASDEGTLKPVDKCRGSRRGYCCLISHMKKCGYSDGQVIISHTNNPSGAEEMNELIQSNFNYHDAVIMENRGLCSYYAEPGSVLIGFEVS